jgi:hypothetical protein
MVFIIFIVRSLAFCISTINRSIKSFHRSALTTTTATDIPAYKRGGGGHGQQSLFVKVYMEGVPIGRKLDLLLLDGYDGLLALLARMFKASIIRTSETKIRINHHTKLFSVHIATIFL